MKYIIMEKIRNLMNKFKSPLLEFFHLLIGFSIIGGLFYLRLLPRISRDLYENMSHPRILLVCCTLLVIAFNIYNTLKILEIIKTKEPMGIIKDLKDLLEFLVEYIYFTLRNVYQFFWFLVEKLEFILTKKTRYLQYKTVRPMAIFCMRKKNTFLFHYILICLKFVPIIIFLSLFVPEAFYFHHLDLTFKFIPFLLLIYLETFFLFILENYYESYFEGVKSFLEFKASDDPTDFLFKLRDGVTDLPHDAKDFDDFMYYHYYVIQSIPALVEEYKEWKHHILHGYYITLFLQYIRLQIYLFILVYGVI